MGWISMEDRKPEEGQAVWYYFEVVGVHPGRYYKTDDGDTFVGVRGFLTDDVTHWMPLVHPLPPGAAREEKSDTCLMCALEAIDKIVKEGDELKDNDILAIFEKYLETWRDILPLNPL